MAPCCLPWKPSSWLLPTATTPTELADVLHAEVQEPLRHLVQWERLSRTEVDGRFLYTSIETPNRRNQTMARRSAQAVPLAVHSVDLEVSPDELKAAIILFYGLLDEQQRRLFAGLESIRLGHGGDTLLGDFLGLDAHTGYAARVAAVSPREKTPDITDILHCLLEHDTAGDPMTGLRWSRRTTNRISEELCQLGIAVCPNTVARLLHQMGYPLRVNHKQISTDSSPDRNLQFEYLAELRGRFQRRHLPLISDTKKRIGRQFPQCRPPLGMQPSPRLRPRLLHRLRRRRHSLWHLRHHRKSRRFRRGCFPRHCRVCRSCHRSLVAAGRLPALYRFAPTSHSGRHRRQ
jgi:hypothetical protein